MGRPSPSLAAVIPVLAAMSCLLLAWIPGSEDLRGGPAAQVPPTAGNLGGPGTLVERDLRGGSVDVYLVDLRAGEYLQAVVEQRGTDVVLSFLDPAGRTVIEVDSPNGTQGPEPLSAVARLDGLHRLEIRALNAAAGRYALRVGARRPATPRDRLRATAAGAFARAEELRASGGTAPLRQALPLYRAAVGHWESLGERREQTAALRRIGQVSLALGDLQNARGSYETALELSREAGDRGAEASLLNEAGNVYQTLSELERAEAAFSRARGLFQALADRRGEAAALNLLAGLYASRSDLERALDAYSRSLAVWRELGDRAWEAATLHNIGRTYLLLGRTSEALELLRQALRLRHAAGDRRGEAFTLLELGWAHDLAGKPAVALELYDRSIALAREQGNLLAEAGALDRRGTALKRLGRLEEALAAYRSALEVFQRSGQPGSMAHTLANLGWLFEARGDPRTAVAYGERALRLFRQLGDRHAESYTLLGIARAERRLGKREAARARIEEALGILESLRGAAPLQALRTTYLASRHDYYEFAVGLLMELGLTAQAWEVAERARARSLLESVGEGNGAQPLDEDLRRLILAGGEIRSRLRDGRAGPAAASLSLLDVQRQVLDGDTLLLQYALGEERSFLWVVGPDSLAGFALPGRRRIEELARRAYGLLPRSHQRGVRQQARLALATLSDAVLGPAARRLAKRRLLIVADGALQYIPFAALPVAGPAGRRVPLLSDHEVVSLPSASVLARLRRERRHRPPSSHLVAVIADPVFQRSDPRVRRETVAEVRLAALERSAGDLGLDGLGRLPHTRREAAAILELVPAGESLVALDFAASRDLVLAGRLGPYRIVHFATHGLLDSERPGRSGLVLSLVDERGRPRHGFLGVHEIHGLDLDADLVVLSACRTALGREVRGEGLLGLTQAFLQAGAGRVVVSLWSVNDAAAAELMSRFYRGMLRQGLAPARALRAAQLEMSREPRWEAPYYWAGFSLLGDWR